MKACFKKLFSLTLFLGCILCLRGVTCAFGADENAVSKNKPMLSVVMPVYNVAPYLDEALDSVENQTYKDMEIICVNDGSTDGSLQILENHARKDGRVRVIDQKNKGVSEARNVGLRASCGEYIYFFDPDDVLAPYTMEKSVNLLEKYEADIVKFKNVHFKYNEKINPSKYSYDNSKVKFYELKPNDNCIKFFNEDGWEVWSHVYRRSVINKNNIEFNKNIGLGEDLIFSFIFGSHMKKVVRDGNVGYFYRLKRPGSIMSTDYKANTKRLLGNLAMIHELALNKNKFKFKGSAEYLLGVMFKFVYNSLKSIKPAQTRSLYAKKVLFEIDTNFVKKYKVKLSKDHANKLRTIKSWV